MATPKRANNVNPYHRAPHEVMTKVIRFLGTQIFKQKRATFWPLEIQYGTYHSN